MNKKSTGEHKSHPPRVPQRDPFENPQISLSLGSISYDHISYLPSFPKRLK